MTVSAENVFSIDRGEEPEWVEYELPDGLGTGAATSFILKSNVEANTASVYRSQTQAKLIRYCIVKNIDNIFTIPTKF